MRKAKVPVSRHIAPLNWGARATGQSKVNSFLVKVPLRRQSQAQLSPGVGASS
jgi:hypothetical protein